MITLILLSLPHMSSTPTKNFSYSKFVSEVEAGDVHAASVNPSGAMTGTLKSGDNYTSQIPTAIDDPQLAHSDEVGHSFRLIPATCSG